eukprot:CAMPEP_0172465886 /NCGR_PEP_ID=MMETSP1065-20121228/54681_1 /TAXON_ID=265537 /ORGANISM="Amphiprora paludosa, Strain CCMP125" /LENGTH=79 /DNA_ID=CAMNT_0013222545 /DNA_START=267 /DNA_END=506 /DNA_ORIENTATION=-
MGHQSCPAIAESDLDDLLRHAGKDKSTEEDAKPRALPEGDEEDDDSEVPNEIEDVLDDSLHGDGGKVSFRRHKKGCDSD